MTIIRPIWIYEIELWCSTKPWNPYRIQSLQSKILRKILNAPWPNPYTYPSEPSEPSCF
ncbi:unnamed protein product [Nezara viridula]|uniref:Uncharacterized protein n=1 Tax=Nezara viridula TaxID=85310 RepID=A0A9P0H9V7_NEZVI|nr:unnamed protein product [Nezara viridula]